MFSELHISLLKYLVENHVKISVLDNGELVRMRDIIKDMDYVYVYRGQARIKMEHIYGQLGPRDAGTATHRYSVLSKGQSMNPLNLVQFLQSGRHEQLINQRISKIQAVCDDTVILQLDGYFIRNFFDPSKQHNIKYQGRNFEGILRDAMSGYFGINQIQRNTINDSFKFEIMEPSTLLVEEGTRATDFIYILLRGKIDVRQRLPAKATLNGIGQLQPRSAPENHKTDALAGLYGDIV